MPSWYMQACDPTGTASALYAVPVLGLTCAVNLASRAFTQLKVRGSYTWSKLFVRVISYVAPSNTFHSEINGVDGNQTVTLNATGTFEDNVNSDALLDGDLINWEGGGSSTIKVNLVGCVLEAASDIPIIGASYVYSTGSPVGANASLAIEGYLSPAATELNTQYVFRSISTLSNLTVYCSAWTSNLDLYLRKNGVNGNSHVHITATGRFEDAVNTDAVAVGDTINTKAGAAGSVNLTMLHLKSSSVGRQIAATACAIGRGFSVGPLYVPLEGNLRDTASGQGKARMNWSGKNLFVRVITNTRVDATTVSTRKGGADANLNISIGAAATGTFEDTVNTDSFLAADLHQYRVSVGVGAGTVTITIIGFEQQQPVAASSAGSNAWLASLLPELLGV